MVTTAAAQPRLRKVAWEHKREVQLLTVILSPSHLVTRSLGHLVIQSLGHSVIWSLFSTWPLTDGHTDNIRTFRSASQTNMSLDFECVNSKLWNKCLNVCAGHKLQKSPWQQCSCDAPSCEYKLRVAKWRLVANIGGYMIANTQRDKRGAVPGVASVQLRGLHTFTAK